MTSYGFAFLEEYRTPNGARTGAYYLFEDSPGDLGFKAFGSYYLLFN